MCVSVCVCVSVCERVCVCVFAHGIRGRAGCMQVYSHDIHEIRAYNRLGLMADSELLITLQVSSPQASGQLLYPELGECHLRT